MHEPFDALEDLEESVFSANGLGKGDNIGYCRRNHQKLLVSVATPRYPPHKESMLP